MQDNTKRRLPFLFTFIAIVLPCLSLLLIISAIGNDAKAPYSYSMSTGLDNFYELSESKEFSTLIKIASKEKLFVDQIFKTNNCQISIKNESPYALYVFLYDNSNMSEPIMEFELEANQTELFTNLTAAKKYRMGIASLVTTEVKLIIGD